MIKTTHSDHDEGYGQRHCNKYDEIMSEHLHNFFTTSLNSAMNSEHTYLPQADTTLLLLLIIKYKKSYTTSAKRLRTVKLENRC